MTDADALIADAAAAIAIYDCPLADAFVAKPFARVDMAYAFAAGFGDPADEARDPHPVAALVIATALADRKRRQLQAA